MGAEIGDLSEGGSGGLRDPLKVRLRFLVLSLLAVKPFHGYELSRMVEEVTLGTLKAGPGSLYPLLKDLAREGLVREEEVVEQGRLRKVYALTERGWTALAAAIEVARAITSNVMELLNIAGERLKSKEGYGCVPREVVEYLVRLEGTAKKLRRLLEERVCSS